MAPRRAALRRLRGPSAGRRRIGLHRPRRGRDRGAHLHEFVGGDRAGDRGRVPFHRSRPQKDPRQQLLRRAPHEGLQRRDRPRLLGRGAAHGRGSPYADVGRGPNARAFDRPRAHLPRAPRRHARHRQGDRLHEARRGVPFEGPAFGRSGRRQPVRGREARGDFERRRQHGNTRSRPPARLRDGGRAGEDARSPDARDAGDGGAKPEGY